MKEQTPVLSPSTALGINTAEGLAIVPQTVYAGVSEGHRMPDITSVEGIKQAPVNGEPKKPPLVDKEKVPDEAKANELEEKAAKAIKEAVDEIRKEKRGAAPTQRKAEEVKKSAGEKKTQPVTEYFPEMPKTPSLQNAVAQFQHEAAGWTLEELAEYNTGFLIKQYVKLHLSAPKDDRSFLSSIERTLERKGFTPTRLVSRTQQEGVLAQGVSGGSPDIDTTDIHDERLLTEAAVVNAIVNARGEDDIDALQKSLENVVRLNGAVPADEKQRLIERITAAIRNRRTIEHQEREQVERRRDPSFENTFLERTEAGEFNPGSYRNDTIHGIAREVQDSLGGPGVESRATNQYFKDKIDQLFTIQTNPANADNRELLEEARRLQREVQSFKDALSAKVVTRQQEVRQSLYGEIRLGTDEERELIQWVLDAWDSTKSREERDQAERNIERKFNKLFGRADINANEDWNSALGPAGSLEIDNFMVTLDNTANGRILPFERRLTEEEKDQLRTMSRRLAQEKKLREYLHTIGYYANKNFATEEVYKISGSFSGEEADLAYRTKGASKISHFFEQAMFQVIARHGGYLPYEAMINKLDGTYGEVETLVREHIKGAMSIGDLPSDMEPWEISRAISLARGMGIMSGRFFEVVSQAGVSQAAPLASWWANDVIKNMAFFKQIARYNIGHFANRFLCFKLEKPWLHKQVWSIKELTEVKDIYNEVAFGLTEKDADDRYISVTNPFRIGSVFTQTRWRFVEDQLNYAGAMARLLDGYKENPLIGAGMWIEKLRPDIQGEHGDSPAEKKQNQIDAEKIIRNNLRLSAKITPLKLFYNLPWLERQVLENHYLDRLSPGDQEAYRKSYRDKKDGEKTRLFLRRKIISQMDEDLSVLTIVQEKLMGERATAYQEAYADFKLRRDAWEAGGRSGPEPTVGLDLYSQHAGLPINADTIADGARRARVDELATHIREEFLKQDNVNRLVNELKHKGWKVPFVFGADDIPYDLLDWTATGGSSFKRRWGDINSAAQAAGAYEELLQQLTKVHDQDTLIKMLDKVYQTLRGHDETVTKEVMFRTVEGITKFFKKGWQSRLPFMIGTSVGALGGAASYAQRKFGREQMAWDETQSYTFVHKAFGANLIDLDQMHQLEALTGSRAGQVTYDMGRTISGLIIAGLVLYMATRVLEEK